MRRTKTQCAMYNVVGVVKRQFHLLRAGSGVKGAREAGVYRRPLTPRTAPHNRSRDEAQCPQLGFVLNGNLRACLDQGSSP